VSKNKQFKFQHGGVSALKAKKSLGVNEWPRLDITAAHRDVGVLGLLHT